MFFRVFITIQFLLVSTSLSAQSILINELMSSNKNFIIDFEGDYPDWIEIYNTSSTEINLVGYFLTDKENEEKWSFPDVSIEAAGYLVVFASGKDVVSQGEIHTNFKLDSDGESVYLYNQEFQIVDHLKFGKIPSDVSFGRVCDNTDLVAFYNTPSFQLSNCDSEFNVSDVVSFSVKEGFYEEEINLQLDCNIPNAEIFYTIDNSLPDTNSIRFVNEILLKDKTPNTNNHSNILLPNSDLDTLDYFVSKLNVIRAGCFYRDTLISEIKTKSYFVNKEASSKYPLPVISLVTDPDNLFSDEIGIYVDGSGTTPNYDKRGIAWERPIHFEFFSPQGKSLVSQNAGVRIQGGTTRFFVPRPLRLYARSEYGESHFDYDFFEQGSIKRHKRLILRNSGQDIHQTFFRDALMHNILKSTSLDVQAYSPVTLYINGEYWGITNLRERHDEHYIASHYGIEPENVIYVPFGCGELNNYAKSLDLSIESNYESISAKMDIQNFIDLSIADNFFYRWDYGNRTPWKTSSDSSKWRFFLYDMDVGMGGFDTSDSAWTYNYFQYMVDPFNMDDLRHAHKANSHAILYTELLKNEKFRELFINTYISYLKTIFKSQNLIQEMKKIRDLIDPEMPDHIKRWGRPNSRKDWMRKISVLEEFALRRPCSVYRQLSDFFNVIDEELESLDCDNVIVGFGDNDFERTGIRYFPNPTSGVLNIEFENQSAADLMIEVFNSQGQLVYSKVEPYIFGINNYEIDISSLTSGIYIVKLNGDNDSSYRVIRE